MFGNLWSFVRLESLRSCSNHVHSHHFTLFSFFHLFNSTCIQFHFLDQFSNKFLFKLNLLSSFVLFFHFVCTLLRQRSDPRSPRSSFDFDSNRLIRVRSVVMVIPVSIVRTSVSTPDSFLLHSKTQIYFHSPSLHSDNSTNIRLLSCIFSHLLPVCLNNRTSGQNKASTKTNVSRTSPNNHFRSSCRNKCKQAATFVRLVRHSFRFQEPEVELSMPMDRNQENKVALGTINGKIGFQ